jgi:CheY-like chemotaxis protein
VRADNSAIIAPASAAMTAARKSMRTNLANTGDIRPMVVESGGEAVKGGRMRHGSHLGRRRRSALPRHRARISRAFRIQVIEAADAESALTLLRDERVDLLSTGINLGPGMTGIELARLAREQCPGLKVIFVSGDHRIERLEPRDRNHFVSKPYRGPDLAQAVADLLATPD